MMRRLLLAFVIGVIPSLAFAQQTVINGGPWTVGHVPMYVGQSSSFPVVTDGGPAGGANSGGNIGEIGITMRNPTGIYPAVGTSTGVLGTPFCMYDAPLSNASGYHYLCLGPNDSANAGAIIFGAGGAASAIPFNLVVNGATYQFPFVVGGIVGPASSVVNDAACWNNLTGTLLKDCGAFVTVAGNNTWSGTNNFTSTFQIGGVTQTFPASGGLVGASDTQSLTNKSINAVEVNSGTLSATVMPALTGNVTSSAGSVATTIANNAVTNAMLAAAGAANTIKGAATSTAVTDLAVPSCSGAGNGLQWATGTGLQCGTFTNQTAGFGLQGSATFSISQSQPPFSFDAPINMGLTASVASSALTITMTGANGSPPSATNPVLIPFRNATLTTGVPVWTAITATQSITVNSAATLGTSNNVPFRIWIFEGYNAGSPQLEVATCSTTTQIYPCTSWEYVKTTSTAISGFATAAGTLYAPSGVSNDVHRIIGFCDFANGLATAGSWASSCTTLQVFGPGIKKPGDIVQIVSQSTTTATVQGSSTTKNATNSTASITPTASMNLIRVEASSSLQGSGGTSVTTVTQIGRNSNANLIGNIGAIGSNDSGNDTNVTSVFLRAIDLPQTTSSTTYTVFIWQTTASGGGQWIASQSSTPTNSAILQIEEIQGAIEPAQQPANDNVPLRMTG